MKKNNTNPKKKTPNAIEKSEENIFYSYPKAEEIFIDKSNLQIQLNKFKEKIKSSFSVFDVLAIISLWVPVFSADFKSIFQIPSNSVEAGYIVFAIIFTAIIIYLRVRFSIFSDEDVDDDPEKMAQKILEQCQKKNK